MKIGIDYTMATATTRGMGRYVREVVRCLIEMDKENEYFLYSYFPIQESLPANFQERHLPSANVILVEQWYLPRMAKRDNLDVLWSPANTFPVGLSRKIKLVVTIHDLIFMQPVRGKISWKQVIGRLYRRGVVRYGHSRIDRCMSVSQYSAHEIEQQLNIPQVEVTYNCISSFIQRANRLQGYPPNLPEKYFFTLSGDAPNKNLPYLIDVFTSELKGETLVIAGVPQHSALRARQSSKIIFVDAGISDDVLIAYYQHCYAFLFLSLSEGFGIPLLEAMSCGAKIIASNATSIPEVLGPCGVLVSPTDRNQLLQAIHALNDWKIEDNIRLLQLQKFQDWHQSAQVVLSVLKN